MSEKYCVYDESIVPGLKEAVQGTQDAIKKARELYPDCDVGAMFWTLAHRVATLATNAALGYPLDRLYSDSAKVLPREYVNSSSSKAVELLKEMPWPSSSKWTAWNAERDEWLLHLHECRTTDAP